MLSKHSGISAVLVIFYDRDSIRSPSTVLAATNCTPPIALLPSVPRRDPSNAVLDRETMTMRTQVRQNDFSHFVDCCDDPTPEVRALPQYNLRNAQPLFVFLVYLISNDRRERSFLFCRRQPRSQYQSPMRLTRRVLAIHTACTSWCVQVRLLQTAILASPFC